jgi:hypothetical protein
MRLSLDDATSSDWELIRWIEAPDVERFKADLDRLGESLILVAGLIFK